MVALWLKAVALWRCGGVAKARDVASVRWLGLWLTVAWYPVTFPNRK